MTDFIIASSHHIFPGSSSTQIFVICKNHQRRKFIISFSGYLSNTNDDLDNFRCTEISIYTNNKIHIYIKELIDKCDTVNEDYSIRKFVINQSLKKNIVKWLFEAKILENLN